MVVLDKIFLLYRQFHLTCASLYADLTDSALNELVLDIVAGNDQVGPQDVRASVRASGLGVQRRSKHALNKSWSCCPLSGFAETRTSVCSGGGSKLIMVHRWKPQADKVATAIDLFSTYFDQNRNQYYISCMCLPLLLYQCSPLIFSIWF